jgi:pyruvate formate lyase activating enzyme
MERSEKGFIFNIKRFAVHDGPGIRTAVFLKGCPLNCIWCHNPEGISQDITIWYNNNICIGCGSCVAVCPEKAIELLNNKIKIDRNLCSLSGNCVSACPTGAIEFTGRYLSANEVMKEILKDSGYFSISGGGVTLTGGEPLFQPDFTLAILKECKDKNIDTAIETCLHCERDILDKVLPYTDHFLADLKIFDSQMHEQFTGKKNLLIKENLEYLIRSGKDITVRLPLIPGITDIPSNIDAVKGLVRSIDPEVPVEVLNFNHLTGSKYRKLGLPWMEDGNINALKI